MELNAQGSKLKPDMAISLGLFLLACLPRAYDLQRFVTADEAKWVYRSAQFMAAFLRGDLAATSVNLTPAVTTTWLGSLGLTVYYRLNQAAMDIPFTDWLNSLPEFRTDIEVLAATRWPMVWLTSFGVVIIYWLARRLFNRPIAVIAAAFIALDPHTVALSRILGHDAPTALFMSISVLLLLLAANQTGAHNSQGAEGQMDKRNSPAPPLLRSSAALVLTVLSGVAGGLAILSKAPALFLVPFAGLVFISKVWHHSERLFFWTKRFLLWTAAAYLTFLAFWPAAWVEPLERPLAVVQNAFLSATDREEADEEGYWLVPDLGPFYYVINGTFKLSPMVMVGAGMALIFIIRPRGRSTDRQAGTVLWLFIFILLFTMFMTLSDKRSARYILPVFPIIALVAAYGWVELYQVANGRLQVAGRKFQAEEEESGPTRNMPQAARLSTYGPLTVFCAGLVVAAAAILVPYSPYYFTYFNPLLGGSFTAPHWVKIGWGEGLDQVGRFLQREAMTRDSRVGTAYASTVASFFTGDLSTVTGSNLDYVVLYRKQVQAGEPSPTSIRYYEQTGPVFSVDLNGIHYADVYPGPAVQPALTLKPGLDHAILPKPIAFRPLTPYGRLGETLTVDVIWLADEPLPLDPSTVTLEPVSAFDFLNEHNHPDGQPVEPRQHTILAEGEGFLTRVGDNLVVSRHELRLPADLGRGFYAMLVDGRPLGEVELRHFQVPAELGQVDNIVFGDQIALAGYQFSPTADYIGVTAAWQAQQSRLPDYTIFVQLLEAESHERVAGVDAQPLKGEWPTSRWARGEVVVDDYFVALPPDLPPGFYNIIVGLYRPETGERLILPNGQDHWILPWTYILHDSDS